MTAQGTKARLPSTRPRPQPYAQQKLLQPSGRQRGSQGDLVTCMRRPCGILTGWGSFPITRHDAIQINGSAVDTSDSGVCPWDDSLYHCVLAEVPKSFLVKCAFKRHEIGRCHAKEELIGLFDDVEDDLKGAVRLTRTSGLF